MDRRPYCLFPRNPGLFSSLNVQKNMLEDSIRTSKLKNAISRTVRPGDIVIDLGTGTGILAIWAIEAGARHVYAIEETDIANIAEAVIADNGLQERITVLRANSSEIVLSEPADVLIAEVIGHFFFEEGIVESIADVRERLLKQGARIIPGNASVFLGLAELGGAFSEVSFWKTWNDPCLGALGHWAANTAYVHGVNPEQLLSEGEVFFQLCSADWRSGQMETTRDIIVARKGTLDALVGWFCLDLGSDVSLSTSPFDAPTHWKQCVFPFTEPVSVSEGDRISIKMDIAPFGAGSKWLWSASSINGQQWREIHEFPITYGTDSRLIQEHF